eukprot:TRINITY_DN2223_c0_g8_i1.p1 TRINITY_DN2223_c0_g8~~TRINITY_DN2223_c0_g8_i1.p1  ORF type:complete len:1265 (+),score=314.55 TRINITY_DN2223_c0_g8_i1:206-4000(+)
MHQDAYTRKHIAGSVDDLVLMEKLAESEIARNLKARLAARSIYTNISSVLICVNPFVRLPLYTEEWVQAFRTRHMNDLPPHIFAVAESTYRAMVQEEEDQCIIISGESGAGKTEASKQVMQYIAAVSGDTAEMRRVKQIMLESNPLLEAFGNAKTVRNDNSSRFGKFFEIYFDSGGGPVGGKISNFLLEKSRVVGQQRGERCFHIFYQLVAACGDGMFSSLKLSQGAQAFKFLSGGGTLTVDGMDDKSEFAATSQAFEAMGIDAAGQLRVWELLAAILHIGNVTFKQKTETECEVADRSMLQHICSLLGVDASLMERSITWRAVDTGKEFINIPLEMQECVAQRDAFAKVVYEKVFDFVVDVVNKAFGPATRRRLMIGVLDIYGFEIFERNSFEQFCINYVNEKLQQIFIELTLNTEQEEYVREKIKWDPIKFFNNKTVVDLIEGKNPPGLFRVIDDVCQTMAKEDQRAVDGKMLDKLDTHCGSHRHFSRTEWGFIVRHYAGDVEYNRTGFVAKNKDTLTPDLMSVVVSCKQGLMQTLFKDEREELESQAAAKEAEASGGPAFGPGRGAAAAGGKKRTTLGMKIVTQAGRLVTTLMACTPHYVRCIKPNDQKLPLGFVDDRVQHQVKYLGLLENVRVRRAGFAYRQYFEKFLKRFKYLSPQCFPRPWKGDDKSGCRAILSSVPGLQEGASFQFGETKIFLRRPEELFRLEELRSSCFDKMAASIQRAYRNYKKRVVFVRLRAAIERFITKHQKQRRSGSVLRAYRGTYVEFTDLPEGIKEIFRFRDPLDTAWHPQVDPSSGRTYFWNTITNVVSWVQPQGPPERPRVDFSDWIERVKSHKGGVLGRELLVITDEHLWLMEIVRTETVVKGTPGRPARGKQPAVPAVPDQTIVTVHHVLRHKISLAHVRGLSLSLMADTYIVVHLYDIPAVAAPPLAPKKGVEGCYNQCGALFVKPPKPPPKGQPRPLVVAAEHCHRCGGVFCGNCAAFSQAMPEFGYHRPVRVCQRCFGKTATEPCEDLVLSTECKHEILAVLKQRLRLLGRDAETTFNDQISYNNRSEAAPPPRPVAKRPAPKKPAGKKGAAAVPEPAPTADPAVAPVAKTITFQYDQNPYAPFPTLYASPPHALVITVGGGVDMTKVADVERQREARRKAAQDRFMKEQEEERKKEAAKEAEREAERKRMVEVKKAERAAELERQRLEEEEKERKRQDKEERRARVVAQHSTKPAAETNKSAVPDCKQCGCDTFAAHPLRPKQCTTCFHAHV